MNRQKEKRTSLDLATSPQFENWLKNEHISLIFTTHQAGKVLMLGINKQGTLHVGERTFSRCMGLGKNKDANTLWISSQFQLWRFDNSMTTGRYLGCDKVFFPRVTYTTGDLDIQDIVIDKHGRPVFVNTIFGCLATTSETSSFKPVWWPPAIDHRSGMRYHLNGLAEKDGEPTYVTMTAMDRASDGWKVTRHKNGIVMNIKTNEIVFEGLSMPHSPRWHEGKLYLLEGGTGYLGYVDFKKNIFERVACCPGFLSGLDFAGNYAIVSSSSVRKNTTFSEFPLETVNTEQRCGIQIINLETGVLEHWVRLEGTIKELYDIKALTQVDRPLLIGTMNDEVCAMISMEV